MLLRQGTRIARAQWHNASRIVARRGPFCIQPGAARRPAAWIHTTARLMDVKPLLLADIGEGIVECEVTQWFVEPGARVEEFSPLCEVQSDKASVEITSRFAGVVKKLYYETGDVAKVGKPFVDIDVEEEEGAAGDAASAASSATPEMQAESSMPDPRLPKDIEQTELGQTPASTPAKETNAPAPQEKGKAAHISTPAVRHLAKEHDIDIADISGTGKDGRVLKEDIQKFVRERDSRPSSSTQPSGITTAGTEGQQQETVHKMTNTQVQMFKAMTRSLSIPHFLYSDEVDFSALHELRARLNKVLTLEHGAQGAAQGAEQVAKLTYLPFVIKAVSMALYKYPVLNARVDIDSSSPSPKPPSIIMRSQHNVGVAMDTPSGLVVPVIRDVGSRNILSIAAELVRLQNLALAGKLSPRDMTGGTITVSNIGGIGGTYLSPVIVEREVVILGVGRVRTVPAFVNDHDADDLRVVKKRVCNFSWSADHRVVDGATMARASEVMRRVVEEPDIMVMHLR